jgi:outer membrane protein assembly factor BamB
MASAVKSTLGANKLALEKAVTLNTCPESIAGDGDALLVSLMGPEPKFIESKDGSIRRLLWDGSVDASFEVRTPLNNPMGLAAVGDKIAVVDIDRVVVLQRATGELASEISLKASGTLFLNGLTMVGEHQVAISASDIKKLFLVDLASGEVRELILDFDPGQPNGLCFEPATGSLYISRNARHKLGNEGNGSVTRAGLDLAGGRLKHVWSTAIGKFLDGIELKGDTVVVSDWVGGGADGAIYQLNCATGDVIAREDVGIAGFADLLWDEDKGLFAFLSLTGNEVRFYSMG